jgi:hypothetical protein
VSHYWVYVKNNNYTTLPSGILFQFLIKLIIIK